MPVPLPATAPAIPPPLGVPSAHTLPLTCPPDSGLPRGVPRPRAAWPPPNVTPVHYSPEQLRQRGAEIQAHLGAQLAIQVPAAMEITPGALTEGQDSMDGRTEFTVNGVRSTIGLAVFAPGAPGSPTPDQECAAGACQGGAASSDGHQQVTRMEKLGDGRLAVSVTSFRPTGAVVRLTLTSPAPESGSTLADPSAASGLLTVLATDPAMAL